MKLKSNKPLILIFVVFILIVLSFVALAKCNRTKDDSTLISKEQTTKAISIKNKDVEGSTIAYGITSTDETTLETEGFQEVSNEVAYGTTYDDAKSPTIYGLSKSNAPATSYKYFSQVDSRWKYHPYTILNSSSQNIGSSGCGPTSASMVVSSLTGASGQYYITPDEMGDLYVAHGFRTENSGTYYSAFEWTATYFQLEYKRSYSVDDMVSLLRQGYSVIVSCSNGLFTSGGHFIYVYGVEGNTLKIYDPYLYSGKFDTSSRRGKVTLDGNTVYCTISNFKNYANSKAYFGFKGTNSNVLNGTGESTPTTIDTKTTDTTMYVNTKSSNLNVRNNPNGAVVSSLAKGTKVVVSETSGAWSHIISPVNGWVSNTYLSISTSTSSNPSTTSTTYKTGTYRAKCNVHVRTGPSTSYSAKTYKQLTSNARSQNSSLGNYYYNGYLKGVTFKVTEVIKQGSYYWGKCASGYVRLDNCYKA